MEFFVGAVVRRKDGGAFSMEGEMEGVIEHIDNSDNTIMLSSGLWVSFRDIEVVNGISYEDVEL